MTEAEFQRAVEELCAKLGLMWHHCRDGRSCNGHRGFPDLVISGPAGHLFAELKSETGETTGDQSWWLWQLCNCGRLWRPSDLDSGLIRQELEALTCAP